MEGRREEVVVGVKGITCARTAMMDVVVSRVLAVKSMAWEEKGVVERILCCQTRCEVQMVFFSLRQILR